MKKLYSLTPTPAKERTKAEFERFFEGLEITPPYEGAGSAWPTPGLSVRDETREFRGREDAVAVSGKPTVEELGIDLDEVAWVRAGDQADALEVAILPAWVLVREAGPSTGPIHVFDHGEWSAFVQGVRAGEFDDVGGFPPAN